MPDSIELKIDDKTYSLKTFQGTEDEKAVDITKLRDETGYITLDSGYKNTGATKSAIHFLMENWEFFAIEDIRSSN